MRALRAALTLALGAGLGAAAEGWRRRRADARPAPGLLGRLPVLPVAAAAELPVVPAGPGALAGGGPGELAKYGLPGLAQLKSRESYVLCYDPRTRCALWVVEQLRPERLRGDGDRRSCDFREDESVHAYHRATNADFRGSGFDRGHLAAAANHRWSQKAMDDTFYLSNVAPQVAPRPGLGASVTAAGEAEGASEVRAHEAPPEAGGPPPSPGRPAPALRSDPEAPGFVSWPVKRGHHCRSLRPAGAMGTVGPVLTEALRTPGRGRRSLNAGCDEGPGPGSHGVTWGGTRAMSRTEPSAGHTRPPRRKGRCPPGSALPVCLDIALRTGALSDGTGSR